MKAQTIKKQGNIVRRVPDEYYRFPDDAVACPRCEEDWLKKGETIWSNQHGRLFTCVCHVCSYQTLILFDRERTVSFFVYRTRRTEKHE